MNFFTLAVIITLLVLAAGAGLMFLVVTFANAVKTNELVIETNEQLQKSVNPRQTAGHAIAVKADYEDQLEDARIVAAKRAAALPRGGNMGIGRLATTNARKNKKVTSKGLDKDPVSAVKIAQYHTWNGLQVVKQAAAATTARVGGGKTKQVKRKLKPGVDFEWKDIGGLTGASKRQAIIANAKSKSAAYKALKASGQDMMVVADGAAAAGGVAAAPAAPRIELPPAPDMIVITDDMDPAELRKARIANSKAKSAYNKQLKALDIDPKEVEWTDAGPKLPDTAQAAVAAAQAAAPAPQSGAPAAATAAAPTVELPEISGYTVITDDMDPADVRKARIANAKAKSAYNKELKAAGIDPKTVDWTDSGPVLKAAPAPVVEAAAPAAAAAPAGAPPLPELIEITDDMPNDEKRAARIANAKTKSAYKKELKALGIDPKSVEI